MMTPNAYEEPSSNDETPLPVPLVAAIERARQRSSTPAMVSRLTSQLMQEEKTTAHILTTKSPRATPSRWKVVLAASILAMVAIAIQRQYSDFGIETSNSDTNNTSIHSPINRMPWVLVAYPSIEVDLEQADSKLSEISESLQVFELRREIQATLDEYYDWNK